MNKKAKPSKTMPTSIRLPEDLREFYLKQAVKTGIPAQTLMKAQLRKGMRP